MPRVCMATQKPLQMERAILLHVCLGDLYVGVWIGIVHNLVVDMPLGTFFY